MSISGISSGSRFTVILAFIVTSVLTGFSVANAEEDEFDIPDGQSFNVNPKKGPDIDITNVKKLEVGFRFTGYDLLIVKNPSVEKIYSNNAMTTDQARRIFRKSLVEEIGKTGVFQKTTDGALNKQPEAKDNDRVLILSSTFVQFIPGNQGLRYGVGFGAGKAIIKIETEIRNSQGSILFQATSEEVLTFGRFGGRTLTFFNDALTDNIPKKYASFIKRISSGGHIIEPEDENE